MPLKSTKRSWTRIQERKFPRPIFFDIAKAYPFGLLSEGSEDIVRDPISTNDKGALICVGEVPENSVLNILKGEEKTLLEASREAALKALQELDSPNVTPLLVDCISRSLFLGKNFPKELMEIKKLLGEKDLPKAAGVLSLGEISSCGDGFLEFFNKTIVLGLLEGHHDEF